MTKFLRICSIVGCFTLRLYGNPADLDTSFNLTGTQTVFFSGGASTGYACTVQPDGKLILVGSFPGSIAVARLNTDGSLDTSFNVTGTQTITIGTSGVGSAVALQEDGKILVAGQATVASVIKFAVVRLNIDGSLDTSFNLTGSQTLSMGTTSIGKAIALQADNKIIVAGNVTGPTAMAVARLNTDGSLDASFNLTGSKVISIGTASYCNGVTLQHDGKIILGGRAIVGSSKFAAVRLTTDGMLDTSFNLTGSQTIGIGSTALANAVTMQPDGKILLCGNANTGVASMCVVRLSNDGSLDTSFNLTGSKVIVIGTTLNGSSVSVQKNGKIVAGGLANMAGVSNFGVVRLATDGSFDTSFNTTGTQAILIGTGASCQATTIQPDGKIILAGSATVGGLSQFAAARLQGDPVLCSQIFWSMAALFNSIRVV